MSTDSLNKSLFKYRLSNQWDWEPGNIDDQIYALNCELNTKPHPIGPFCTRLFPGVTNLDGAILISQKPYNIGFDNEALLCDMSKEQFLLYCFFNHHWPTYETRHKTWVKYRLVAWLPRPASTHIAGIITNHSGVAGIQRVPPIVLDSVPGIKILDFSIETFREVV